MKYILYLILAPFGIVGAYELIVAPDSLVAVWFTWYVVNLICLTIYIRSKELKEEVG